MTEKEIKILLIEDNPVDARLFEKLLTRSTGGPFAVEVATGLASGLDSLEQEEARAVVLDLGLPDSQGMDTFRAVHSRHPATPIIVLSGEDDENMAVQAVQAGAQDYLMKGELNPSQLGRAIRYAIERQAQETRINQLNSDLEKRIIELAHANRELDLLSQTLTLARDQALQASAYKSEFVARMSHEIRTPISAVIGTIELLKITTLDHEQQELVNIIDASADCLLTVVNEVLDYSKLEAGKVQLEYSDFSLVHLIENTTDLMAPVAAKKNIAMMVYIDPVLNVVNGDPVRCRQILLNLLGNAVKFTDKGEITVRATRESVDETTMLVRFSVTDTGKGLAEDATKKLFQPFVQVGGEERAEGTGLGLTISKRLVEMMNGQIGVRSIPGKGSTFWFSLRLKHAVPGSVTDSLPLRAMAPDLAGLRVLLVDDSENASQILQSYLKAAGFRTSCAAGADEGLEMLRHNAFKDQPFEVAIIDLRGIDGALRMAAEIGEDPTISRTRLIFLTSLIHGLPNQDLWRKGFSSYLTKPVRQSALIASILDVTFGSMDTSDIAVTPESVSRSSNWQSPDSKQKSILVAEDNTFLQKVITKVLKRLGYATDIAVNGAQAVEKVKTGSYSLVLMDCQMPIMDGFEATRTIRSAEREGGKRIPIVAMTASVRQTDRDLCIESGMDAFLSKPVTMEKLQQVLASACFDNSG
ncbi:MAG: response regulator [Cyanobacteria bacterium]|nr:response regulator [Cyanobacteriota bacterium]